MISSCCNGCIMGCSMWQIVKSTLQTICKCHGLTGACNVKICWRSLPKVQVVGFILKEKYRNALQVSLARTSTKCNEKCSIVCHGECMVPYLHVLLLGLCD